MDLPKQVVDLTGGLAHLDRRIDETSRPDDDLDRLLGALLLVRAGRGGDVDHLLYLAFPFRKRQRSVVKGRRQPETIVDQRDLARPVATVHATNLRDPDMGLVDHDQGVLGKKVHQRVGLLPGAPAGEVPGVVLDPGAATGLAHHLQVEHGPLPEPLGLEQLALAFEPGDSLLELIADGVERPQQFLPGRHVVGGREDLERLDIADDLARQRVELDDALHLVAVELDPGRDLVIRRLDVDGVAAHPKARPAEVDVVALVLQVGQFAKEDVATKALAGMDLNRLAQVVLGRTDAVDARHAGHDDDVGPGQQRPGGGLSQAVDLVISG